MRYLTAILGATFICAAVFTLALLTTNWAAAIARLERDGFAGLLRENIPSVLLAGLAGSLSFAGTLRHYRKKDREREVRRASIPAGPVAPADRPRD